MVATIGQMASAEYYLESQRSYRHPNEYYTAGEEPDGTWFNPNGLFALKDGAKVDTGEFQRLYNGFAPDGAGKLVQRAGNPSRSPGVDMTFSVDKSISALWAIAEPEMRAQIESLAVDAAREALKDTVLRYCSYTRVSENGVTRPVSADLMGATFVHGTSRENDPQLHVHSAIFNLRLGVRMEQYGPNAEFTRIKGMPEDLLGYWSKRRKAIVARAGELGIPALGNAARLAGVNKLTRAGKSHDNEPEIRHRRWRGEAASFTEREELVAAVTGYEVEVPREVVRELTERLDGLPEHLARQEAVFRRPDMVEAAANAAAGLMGREAVGTTVERLRRNPEIERLEPRKPTAESEAGMAHTEVYSTRHNLRLEQAVRDMAGNMAADTGHGLPAPAVESKVETLLERGYPLSEEQISAIRFATARAGRVAVIEGAAGSGQDHHAAADHRPAPRARLRDRTHRSGLAHSGGAGRRLRRQALLRGQAAEAGGQGSDRHRQAHPDRGRRGGDAIDPPGPSHPSALGKPWGEGGVRGGHAPAAAGGGRTGAEIDPRCCWQRAGGPYPAPEG